MKNLHTNFDLSSVRILQIEVIDNPIETHSNAEDFSTSADWTSHNKRIREDIKNENGIISSFSPKPLHFMFFYFPVFEMLEGKIIIFM
jgi:hypothetical protein